MSCANLLLIAVLERAEFVFSDRCMSCHIISCHVMSKGYFLQSWPTHKPSSSVRGGAPLEHFRKRDNCAMDNPPSSTTWVEFHYTPGIQLRQHCHRKLPASRIRYKL